MNHIIVMVTPRYLPEQSDQANNTFAFAYHVSIENRGNETVQLMSRHWIITDGNSRTKEVKGPGVVGEQPMIDPGQSHHYTSGVTLNTTVGTMEGSYQMILDSGEAFDVTIPAFLLSVPGSVH
ncbi:MAG: ApaG protein [Porticoccus sp.]|jgi:ApaG protein